MPVTAYVGLGANAGDRRAAISSALAALRGRPGVEVTAVSPLFETEPVGPPDQGPYLNAAARLETTLAARDLLAALHDIEAAHGRDRSREQRWGPRPLDLDLLLYGDEVIDEPGLKVPHPRMHERRFVLEPLARIAPDAVHPGTGRTIQWLVTHLERPAREP